MILITPTQILMARAALRLSQAEVAAAAGLSTTAFNSVEQGLSDPKISTIKNVKAALEGRGAVFGSDGSVRIGPPRPRFIVADPENPPDRETRAAAIQILNASQKARGLPAFVDDEDF
jgi:transcriptional regulator with XRE-family HTH domain